MGDTTVQICWLDPGACGDLAFPAYQSRGASGMDVQAAVKSTVEIAPGQIVLISTGFCIAIPSGYEIQVRPRSGLAIKHGITIVNSPGTIDSDYRGEVKIGLINLGPAPYVVRRGDRICQMILAPVAGAILQEVVVLDSTHRGSGGFGHTGL